VGTAGFFFGDITQRRFSEPIKHLSLHLLPSPLFPFP
jgi:hypothetical protein